MTTATESAPGRTPGAVPGLATIVGFLVCVEIASGILQGYYTPIFSDIADHLSIADADVNWFEAAQLVVSALVVPCWPGSVTSSATARCCCCRRQ